MRFAKHAEKFARLLSTNVSLAVPVVINPRVCHKRQAKRQPAQIRQYPIVEPIVVGFGGDVPEILRIEDRVDRITIEEAIRQRIIVYPVHELIHIFVPPRHERVLLKLIPHICPHVEQKKSVLVIQVFANIARAIHIVEDMFHLSRCQYTSNPRGINIILGIGMAKVMLMCWVNYPESDLCIEVLEDVGHLGNVTFCSSRALRNFQCVECPIKPSRGTFTVFCASSSTTDASNSFYFVTALSINRPRRGLIKCTAFEMLPRARTTTSCAVQPDLCMGN